MKRNYIQPQCRTELAQCVKILAASRFDKNSSSQNITPSDEEYDDEFAVKEYSFGDDLNN